MDTTRNTIELFHLLFLRQLQGKLDPKFYALKGGCNLRFFFKSIRYSEDIDFDITTISKSTLENKINKVLDSVEFKKILRSQNIEIVKSNPAKQTDTTQRWKLTVSVPTTSLLLPTKIEFSRRKMDMGYAYETIDKSLIQHYHLYPISCNHYERDTAILQKIEALIGRTETQARDIFDIKLLLDQGALFNNIADPLRILSADKLGLASAKVTELQYSDYKGQVVAFLMEEYKDFYDSKEKWHEIQTEVMAALKNWTDHEIN